MNEEPTYDRFGRMNFHPDFHFNQGKPWTTKEQQYLIDWYYKIGPDQVSFDLGRTIHTVMTKAYQLRKKSLLLKPSIIKPHPRTRFDKA